MPQIRFRPGLTTLPKHPSRLGRGYHLPIPYPLDAYGVLISTPLAPRPEFHLLKVGNPKLDSRGPLRDGEGKRKRNVKNCGDRKEGEGKEK